MKKVLIYGNRQNLNNTKALGCELIGFVHSFGSECWIKVPEKKLSKIKAIVKPIKILNFK